MKKTIQNKINNPSYDYETLPQVITAEILSKAGGIYHEDYHETIEYYILNNKQLRNLSIDESLSEKGVVSINRKLSFWLVAPDENEETEHNINFNWYVKKIPGFNKNSHFDIKLSIGEEEIPIKKESYISEKEEMEDYIFLDFHYTVNFKSGVLIEFESAQYAYGEAGSINSFMETLTYNMNVHFSSEQPLDLDAEVFGLAESYYEPTITQNSVSIQFPEWMLPGHGYFISWREV
jgi:hypothetical protein